MVKLTSRVLVYTRVRPPTAKEAKEGLVVSVDSAEHAINLSDKNDREQHVFKCDGVFAPDAAQDAVFEEVGQPVLDATLEGYNGCVLAYGQTGSGKTHTLLNPGESVSDSGLVPRIAAALFFRIGQDLAHVLTVRVSFLQIYNEQIDDLLKPAGASVNLRLRTAPSGAIDVEGATSVRVSSPAALMQLFNQGRKNLVYAETRMNKSSSRSHAVFQLAIEKRARVLGGGGTGGGGGGDGGADGGVDTQLLSAKLTLVDLAGSERVKRSGADADLSGVRFREAVNINTSLLGLGSVMKALGERAKFVPYKDSKLTQLLTDSLGGNCRTALVVCVSPAAADHSETAGALEFGARAMKVAVHARVNEAMVRLDAQRIADDLSEALRMRAAGQQGGRLHELEEALREAEAKMVALAAEREANAAALREAEARVADAPALAAAEREAHDAERSRLLALMRQREGALGDASELLAREREQLATELAERSALERKLAAREIELETERQRRQAVEGTSESMRASLCALQAREAELGAQLGAARERLAAADRTAASAEAAREQTAAEGEAAAAALRAEAEARAALELQLAQATAELAQMAAVRKERSATLGALERQLASAEADAAERAASLRQLRELHDATVRDSTEAAARDKVAAATALHALSAEHARQLAALSAEKETLATRHAALVDEFDAANGRREAEAARLGAERAVLVELRAAAEAHAAAALDGAQRELIAERALRLDADARARDEAEALAADVAALRARGAAEAAEAAATSAALREQLNALRAAHESLAGDALAQRAERGAAVSRADELSAMLRAAEAARTDAEGALARALAAQEAALREMAAERTAREAELRASLDAHGDASARLAELCVRAAAAERRGRQLERRLRAIDDELQDGAMRGRLLAAELRALEEKAAAAEQTLAADERLRLRELRELGAQRDGAEAALRAAREALVVERDALHAELAQLAGERAADAERHAAARAAADARLAATVGEHEGLVASLEGALRRNAQERQRALAQIETESRAYELAILAKEAELAALRGDLHSAKHAELRTRLLAGVSVVKHGRKGAPHRRHVRCSRDLRRLEWSRPGDARAAAPSVGAHEIVRVHTAGPARRGGALVFWAAPLASLGALPESFARLAATGGEPREGGGAASGGTGGGGGGGGTGGGGHFLSLVTATRSVDLEFGSAHERDSWQAAWTEWRILCATSAPHAPHQPAGVADDDEEAAPTGGASLAATAPARVGGGGGGGGDEGGGGSGSGGGGGGGGGGVGTNNTGGSSSVSWMSRAAQRLSVTGGALLPAFVRPAGDKSPVPSPSAAPADGAARSPPSAQPLPAPAPPLASLPPPPAPPPLSPRASEPGAIAE
ncbi:hypothetical protein KFE25_005033 [Diacronema lutheri]|uniref:Kinesin motor domain-containing protein n=1 Tax=Diacronema lutheri TaxID=2081491 RepID=A0A8J5X615_DIALT|nr:hypothetical protein KFE25_005033 [Diacronema lutheri]